jgi:quinol monooxygenase YgiN
MSKPFAVIVEAEIQPERMDEFLKLIEHNAVNSRMEPGCLRFGK